MLTFNKLYTEAQAQAEDTSASSLISIKLGINQGMRKFGAVLNRDWRTRKQTFSTTASQRYYQMPEDCIRVAYMVVTVGTTDYPLTEIDDEEHWQDLTMRTQTSTIPEYFFVDGSDQFGIWPTPSGAYTGTLKYEYAMRDMTQDDYSTGTVTMTLNSQAVVGSSTTWTANMVGRYLFVTDGSPDGMAYKVSAFTDATHITIENFYAGSSGGSKTYLIGECPAIPEEYHESLIDYGLYRYYRRRRDLATAKDLLSVFKDSIDECKATYNSKTSSNYYKPPKLRSGFRYRNQDLTIP